MELKKLVRNIPDFPEKGIIFRDITPVLKDAGALKYSVDLMAKELTQLDYDLIAGPESRGFIFGVPLAYNLSKGFVPVRKAGKLPYKTKSKEYSLEYGTAVIEIHEDAIEKGQRVVIVDDLLATGGTSKAMVDLITDMGGVVAGMIFLIELEGLGGRELLEGMHVRSLLQY